MTGTKTVAERLREFEDGKYLLGDSLFGLKVGGKYGEPVQRPEPEVLDADGVPIKVGDTVWHEGKRECVVKRIYRQIGDTLLDLSICGSILSMKNVKPTEVTHRKPDTHGDIEDDATLPPKEYCSRYHLLDADSSYFDDAEAIEAMCKHLIERTRTLLGGE